MTSPKRGNGPFKCDTCGYGAMTANGLAGHVGGPACARLASKRPSARYALVLAPVPNRDATPVPSEDRDSIDDSVAGHQDGPQPKRARIDAGNDGGADGPGTALSSVLAVMADLRAAVQYETPRRALCARRDAARIEFERAQAGLEAEGVALREAIATAEVAEAACATGAATVASARALVADASGVLDDARKVRASLQARRDAFRRVDDVASHKLGEYVASLSAQLPPGITLGFALEMYYSDEGGRVDKERLDPLVDRIAPTLAAEEAGADAAIEAAVQELARLEQALEHAIATGVRLAEEAATARGVGDTQHAVVDNAEAAAHAARAHFLSLRDEEDEQYAAHEHARTGDFARLSEEARRLVHVLRTDPERIKAICGAATELAPFFNP